MVDDSRARHAYQWFIARATYLFRLSFAAGVPAGSMLPARSFPVVRVGGQFIVSTAFCRHPDVGPSRLRDMLATQEIRHDRGIGFLRGACLMDTHAT
jgi:hypothetical protein